MKLSILLPVYNEVNTLLALLNKVGGVNMEKEIILVDDRSTDGTRELLKEKIDGKIAGIKVFYHEKNKGKGSAVRTALEHADGDYCIIQDADLEYDPEDYISLIARAMDGKEDVVYGSRFLRTWKTTSFTHYMVNGSLTFLTNLLFGSGLTDMETCYKLVRTDVMKSLDLKADRFELEPEITAKLLKKGHKIPEIPVSYKGRSYHEGKKIGWKDGIEAVITLFRLKFSRNK